MPPRWREQHAVADARLALEVSGVCLAALTVLLLTASPMGGAPSDWQPPGPDAFWLPGSLATVVLGPVAIGLSAWTSLTALWLHDDLPGRARRLHLLTLALAAAFAVTFAAAWAGGRSPGSAADACAH